MPFWKKLLLTVFLALIFGAVAAVTFVFGKEFAGRFAATTESETAESVFFPPDTPQTEAQTEPSAAADGTETSAEAAGSEAETESAETPDEDELKALLESLIAADQPDVTDLQQLYRAAYGLVNEAGSSLVRINIARKGTDSFGTEYTYNEERFGVVIAVTSKEYLVATPYAESGLTDGSVSVRFTVGEAAGAHIKSTDSISGLTILAVPVRSLNETVREKVLPIKLGSSYNCSVGQPVIALGAPAGVTGSVRYGMLTHLSDDTAAVDNIVRLLHTDMTSFEGSCGFLMDLNGELVGWFDEATASGGCITAVGISDIKSYLQNLSNGLSTGYLGITGQTLSVRMKEQLGVSENGVYIFTCVDESPAMSAGLMSGDIITSISGEPIASMLDLKTKLLDINTEQTVRITVLRRDGASYQPLDYEVHLERR